MSEAWIKNMIGYAPWQTEELLKDIPNPEIELGIHITTKTVQAGSLIGGVIVSPLIKMMVKDPAKKVRLANRAGIRGALIGLVVGPAMTYAKIAGSKLEHDAIYDRCYRLRLNQGQLMYDRISYLGAILGGALYGMRGISMGINMAVISVFAFKNGLPLLNPPEATEAASGDHQHAQSPKSLLPSFTVKDDWKAPKEVYQSGSNVTVPPGQCTCGCHFDNGKCTCTKKCH